MNSLNSNQISVLLVDDDEDDFFLIKRVFSQIPDSPFVLNWCSTYEKAKKAITAHEHDLYLIDYRLGELSGLDLLEFAEPQKRPEPFILLTGTGDKEVERRSMQLAAADYLVKGTFGPDLLSRTLFYALERKRIEEQRLEHLIELNRTKDEFISLASHQHRTPATGVKQYVGMVLEGFMGNISEAQRTILTRAYESNERQLRIVSDLLKVAQVDAGKVNLRKDSVNLVALIKDVIKEQQATYKQRQQKVKLTHRGAIILATIDRDRMRMVLENLLDNASKYSDTGKTVQVEIEDVSDESVCVRIQDKGVGIAPEDQGKMFEKFSRIHNPLSTHVGGTGLGLYWAKKIVDLHGGKIEFVSEENKGTTFSIYLPKTP
jgi:signal transduction histidine kinase